MPAGHAGAAQRRQRQQYGIDNPAATSRIVQCGYEKQDGERNDGDTLQYAQWAWVEQQDVLRKECETHQATANGEAREIQNTAGR